MPADNLPSNEKLILFFFFLEVAFNQTIPHGESVCGATLTDRTICNYFKKEKENIVRGSRIKLIGH